MAKYYNTFGADDPHPDIRFSPEFQATDEFKDWADKNNYDTEAGDWKDGVGPDSYEDPDTSKFEEENRSPSWGERWGDFKDDYSNKWNDYFGKDDAGDKDSAPEQKDDAPDAQPEQQFDSKPDASPDAAPDSQPDTAPDTQPETDVENR